MNMERGRLGYATLTTVIENYEMRTLVESDCKGHGAEIRLHYSIIFFHLHTLW